MSAKVRGNTNSKCESQAMPKRLEHDDFKALYDDDVDDEGCLLLLVAPNEFHQFSPDVLINR